MHNQDSAPNALNIDHNNAYADHDGALSRCAKEDAPCNTTSNPIEDYDFKTTLRNAGVLVHVCNQMQEDFDACEVLEEVLEDDTKDFYKQYNINHTCIERINCAFNKTVCDKLSMHNIANLSTQF